MVSLTWQSKRAFPDYISLRDSDDDDDSPPPSKKAKAVRLEKSSVDTRPFHAMFRRRSAATFKKVNDLASDTGSDVLFITYEGHNCIYASSKDPGCPCSMTDFEVMMELDDLDRVKSWETAFAVNYI
jgi:hypothetical protein